MKILTWAPLHREIGSFESSIDLQDVAILESESPEMLVETAVRERPQLLLLDDDMPGGALAVIRRLRSSTTSGPAMRFVVRSAKSTRPPADGVVAVPRGDGVAALLSAMMRLLQLPVRANAQAYALLEARGHATGGRLLDALLVDVSVGGMRLRTAAALRMGELVSVAFTLAPSEPLIIAGGRVVRDAGMENGTRFYGVEFNDLTAFDREAISRFVERSLARAEATAGTAAASTEKVPAPASELVGV